MKNKYFYNYGDGYGELVHGYYGCITGTFESMDSDEDEIPAIISPLIMTHDHQNDENNYCITIKDEFEILTKNCDDNIFKYIDENEFKSKFSHVIDLAIEYATTNKVKTIKYVKVKHPDRYSYCRLYIHDEEYGFYTGLLIDDLGQLTIITKWGEPGSEDWDFYDVISEDSNDNVTKINELEFLGKFNQLIEKTRNMIK